VCYPVCGNLYAGVAAGLVPNQLGFRAPQLVDQAMLFCPCLEEKQNQEKQH
jgi:hypothetical protein